MMYTADPQKTFNTEQYTVCCYRTKMYSSVITVTWLCSTILFGVCHGFLFGDLFGAGGGMGGGMGGGGMGGMGGGGMFQMMAMGGADNYNSMMEQRYGCQTDGGYCLDMYPPPASQGGAGGEPPEVEMEGGAPTAQPHQPAGGHGGHGAPGAHGRGKTPGRPGANPPPATPAPPRRMVAHPMHYIRQNCRSFDFDYFSCGRTGGVCCYQRP
ncbi:LOW QUALITY PROTEIN: ESX-1 secretion-associated protein EspB-like [Ylistrum balloti]|uniref:LOW QUALITY PROTEIN: ESX-1 secretion-associated protein EspB-like n=1 Tax=Ylistrum balloti TaxID=509963 RepID=UPI002905A856|nr:LOW QUALITY PROTEIN: ESX-1 secretion-associated protein EspB-like [Ylistrum balloti]